MSWMFVFLAGFTAVNVLKYCSVFVESLVVFDLSEMLSGRLSLVGNVLIYRTNIFVDNIRIESFRAFAFVVKII